MANFFIVDQNNKHIYQGAVNDNSKYYYSRLPTQILGFNDRINNLLKRNTSV